MTCKLDGWCFDEETEIVVERARIERLLAVLDAVSVYPMSHGAPWEMDHDLWTAVEDAWDALQSGDLDHLRRS